MSRDERPFVAHLEDVVEAASEVGERPSPFEWTDGVLTEVEANTILGFNNDPRLDLPLPMLASILAKQSKQAGEINDLMQKLNLDNTATRTNLRKRSTIMRNAVVLRDTLDQMSKLVQGKDLDLEPTFVEDESQEEMMDRAKSKAAMEALEAVASTPPRKIDPGPPPKTIADVMPSLDPIPDHKLREAHVHKMLSEVQAQVKMLAYLDKEEVIGKLEEIKRYIRGENQG